MKGYNKNKVQAFFDVMGMDVYNVNKIPSQTIDGNDYISENDLWKCFQGGAFEGLFRDACSYVGKDTIEMSVTKEELLKGRPFTFKKSNWDKSRITDDFKFVPPTKSDLTKDLAIYKRYNFNPETHKDVITYFNYECGVQMLTDKKIIVYSSCMGKIVRMSILLSDLEWSPYS